MFLILQVFLRLLNSFEIINFLDKKLHLHYSGIHRSKFQVLVCLFFIRGNFFV